MRRPLVLLAAAGLLAVPGTGPARAIPAPPASRLTPTGEVLPPAPRAAGPVHGSLRLDDEDHVVVGEETIKGEERHFDGDVIVAPGGHLTIEDARIVFDVASSEIGLEVLPGGRLDVRRSTMSNNEIPGEEYASRLLRHWSFLTRGPTTITEADISFVHQVAANIGPFTIEGSFVHDTWHSGVDLQRGFLPMVVRNNVIARNHFNDFAFGGGIYAFETFGTVVEGNVLYDVAGTGLICNAAATVGSYVWPDDTRIAGNVVYFGRPGDQGGALYLGLYLDGGTTGLAATDNAIIHSQAAVGTAYDSGAQVLRNTMLGVRFPGDRFGPSSGIVAFNISATGRAYRHLPAFRGNVVAGFGQGLQNQRSGKPVFKENDLLDATWGIRHTALGGGIDPDPAAQLDAAGNWWGDASGPADEDPSDGSSPATNGGAGSIAHGNIAYAGWSQKPNDGPLAAVEPAAVALGPGETTKIPVTVLNRMAKTYFADLLVFNAPPGWDVSAPAGVAVPAKGSATVQVTVTVPPTAKPGVDVAEIVLAARGVNVAVATAGIVTVTA